MSWEEKLDKYLEEIYEHVERIGWGEIRIEIKNGVAKRIIENKGTVLDEEK